MRELYLGFYKKLHYTNLIYISLAELISKGLGHFNDNKLYIKKNNIILKKEIKILNKIKLHDTGKLFHSELEDWYFEIQNELIKNNYIIKYPFFGYKFTKCFKKMIKKCEYDTFNSNIIKYINSQNVSCLIPIISNIERINIPLVDVNFKKAWNFYVTDMIERNNRSMNIRGNSSDRIKKINNIKY
jgi:hypothetical protein